MSFAGIDAQSGEGTPKDRNGTNGNGVPGWQSHHDNIDRNDNASPTNPSPSSQRYTHAGKQESKDIASLQVSDAIVFFVGIIIINIVVVNVN